MSNTALAILFAVLWVVTFVPAWYLVGKLAAWAATPGKRLVSPAFFGLFLLYEAVIALPYLPILIFGSDLPGIVRAVAWAVLIAGLLVASLRFFAAKRIERILWWVYGFVYDGLRQFYPYRSLIENAVDRLEVRPTDRVLDLGCGSGNASERIAALRPAALACVDASTSMMRPLRKKLHGYPATLVESDVVAYLKNCPGGSFDKIVLINVLYAVHDRQALWRELLRVVASGGRIVMTSSDRKGSAPLIKEHMSHASLWRLLHPRLLGVFVVDAMISSFAGTGVFHFISKSEMIAEIEAAGGVASRIERCYGGSKDGVNLIMNVEKS